MFPLRQRLRDVLADLIADGTAEIQEILAPHRGGRATR